MKLKQIAKIQSGHLTRSKIEPHKDGSHFLLQARDITYNYLIQIKNDLIRFNPALSKKDWILEKGDIVFMARGANNYSALITEIPKPTLAAACFFIVRVTSKKVLPDYLFWYLNQAPVSSYLQRHSGRGVHMPIVRREVLENFDIPLPSIEIQKNIAELEVLRKEEKTLIDSLSKKRQQLITASCLKVIRRC